MELRDYVRILHKNWVLILACLLLGIGASAAYAIAVTAKYEASTELYVSVRSGDTAATGDLVQGTTFARQAVTSYVDVVGSAIVLDRVIEELQLDTTSRALSTEVMASSPLNTVLIKISVTNSDPELAAEIANSTGRHFADVVVNDLEKPDGDAPSLVKIETIQPATVPAAPSSPNVPLYLVLGALVGLAIGVGLAVMRTVLDTRIHSLHDIAQVTDKPMLGGIALDPGAKKRPLIVHADPRNPRAESFRSLRTNLQFVNIEGGPRSFVISSAGPGEGKSTTTANLAISLAETGAKVALVRLRLHPPFGFNDYNRLQLSAKSVLSDSGTIAEESSMLQFPAITLRDSIERPEALDTGAIITTGIGREVILDAARIAIDLFDRSGPPTLPRDYEVTDTARRVVSFIRSSAAAHFDRTGIRAR